VGIQLLVCVRTDISAPAVGGHDVKKEHVTCMHDMHTGRNPPRGTALCTLTQLVLDFNLKRSAFLNSKNMSYVVILWRLWRL
jgi:hypothetical protein